MKYFISERICLPIAKASIGLVLISSTVLAAAALPKAIIVVGRMTTPKEHFFDEMIEYSSLIGAIGVTGCLSSVALAAACDAFKNEESNSIQQASNEDKFDYWAEIEKHRLRIRKEVCVGCKYYSNNDWLPCAVHPELRLNCRDFTPKQ